MWFYDLVNCKRMGICVSKLEGRWNGARGRMIKAGSMCAEWKYGRNEREKREKKQGGNNCSPSAFLFPRSLFSRLRLAGCLWLWFSEADMKSHIFCWELNPGSVRRFLFNVAYWLWPELIHLGLSNSGIFICFSVFLFSFNRIKWVCPHDFEGLRLLCGSVDFHIDIDSK